MTMTEEAARRQFFINRDQIAEAVGHAFLDGLLDDYKRAIQAAMPCYEGGAHPGPCTHSWEEHEHTERCEPCYTCTARAEKQRETAAYADDWHASYPAWRTTRAEDAADDYVLGTITRDQLRAAQRLVITVKELE